MSLLATYAVARNKNPPLVNHFILNLWTKTGHVTTLSVSLEKERANLHNTFWICQSLERFYLAILQTCLINWGCNWQSKARNDFQAWPVGSTVTDKYDSVLISWEADSIFLFSLMLIRVLLQIYLQLGAIYYCQMASIMTEAFGTHQHANWLQRQ